MPSISLHIETMILVAIWKNPFIFQGSFKIINKKERTPKLLLFRCECYLENKKDLQEEFFPQAYQFTHLYNEHDAIPLLPEQELEPALYLLKYALNATLEQLLNHSKQPLLYVDEIAMAALAHQMMEYIKDKQALANKDLGFVVSIDFSPKEPAAKMAASALLKICDFDKMKNLH